MYLCVILKVYQRFVCVLLLYSQILQCNGKSIFFKNRIGALVLFIAFVVLFFHKVYVPGNKEQVVKLRTKGEKV